MSKTKKASEVQLMEAFAYILFRSGITVYTPDGHEDKAPGLWRGDKDLRNNYRELALDLAQDLAGVGIGLRSAASPKILDFLENLVTEPPRPAYSIDEVEKAFAK